MEAKHPEHVMPLNVIVVSTSAWCQHVKIPCYFLPSSVAIQLCKCTKTFSEISHWDAVAVLLCRLQACSVF